MAQSLQLDLLSEKFDTLNAYGLPKKNRPKWHEVHDELMQHLTTKLAPALAVLEHLYG
jgi:hypothetical protein